MPNCSSRQKQRGCLTNSVSSLNIVIALLFHYLFEPAKYRVCAVHLLHTCWHIQNALILIYSLKRITVNVKRVNYAAINMYALQRDAVSKCHIADRRYAGRDIYALQHFTIFKRQISNFCYTVGNFNALQRGTKFVFTTSYYSMFCE